MLLLLPTGSFATENTPQTEEVAIFQVIKLEGRVRVERAESIKKQRINVGDSLFTGDRLITYSTGRVKLIQPNGTVLVVEPGSVLELKENNRIKQVDGSTYYQVKKRSSGQILVVETDFAIIGVKGTEFIVYSREDNKGVALNQGTLKITSLEEQFILYEKSLEDEFEAFQKSEDEAWESYKEALEEGFKRYQEFQMEAGSRISFNGNKVTRTATGFDAKDEFSRFEQY